MLLAHGVGTRADLPLPPMLAVVGGGLVLVISFAVLAVSWRRPRFAGGNGGQPVPATLQRVLDARALRVVLQGLTLAAMVLVCVIGLAGPQVTERNLAPWVFYIIFWVGLVPGVSAVWPSLAGAEPVTPGAHGAGRGTAARPGPGPGGLT